MPLPHLLDQAQRLEDTADHAVAQLGHAMGQIPHSEAEGQQARIIDFEPMLGPCQEGFCTKVIASSTACTGKEWISIRSRMRLLSRLWRRSRKLLAA